MITDPKLLRAVADQARAENESGAVAGSDTHQHYLDGVEQALRWVAGDGKTHELVQLLRRTQENVGEKTSPLVAALERHIREGRQ